MPIFLASLLGGLINIAGTLVGRVLLALGISAVTYTGLSQTFDFLRDQAINSFQALPPEIVGMLALMKVGSSFSIILSAIVVKWTLQGLTGGNMRRLVGI